MNKHSKVSIIFLKILFCRYKWSQDELIFGRIKAHPGQLNVIYELDPEWPKQSDNIGAGIFPDCLGQSEA